MQNKTFISIADTVINPQDAINFVTTEEHGAIDIFIGTVRNHNIGKQVTGITYEIFKPLTITILNEISQKTRLKYGEQLNIYISHFNGELAINGISVVIAVSSIHRAETFSSCRFILEELKHHAPIWKQEHYIDGNSDWVKGHSLCSHSAANIYNEQHNEQYYKQKNDHNYEDINGVILLGGKSSRMGQNKALLKFNGEYFINKAINTFIKLKISSIILSGTLDGYKTIPDLIQNCGPIGGICTVLLSSTQEERNDNDKFWLFIPIDMPLLTPETLQQLINSRNQHDAVCFANNIFPLLIKNSPLVMQQIEDMKSKLKQGKNISVASFINSLNTKFIQINASNKKELININTPTDLEEINGS